MAGAKRVIFTLGTFGESADSVFHSITAESLATPRDDLMRICLMANIENKLIVGCIIYIMKSYNKFHCPQTGSEMTRVHRTAFNHILTNLRTELTQLSEIHGLDILGRIDFFQQGVCRMILIHIAFKTV